MSRIKFFYNIILFLLLTTTCEAQRFNFAIKGGLTLSQINGDALAGYDKLGFETGAKTTAKLDDRWDLVIELLYSQRGSSDELTFSGDNALVSIHMDYIAIPVLIEFKDWEVQEDGNNFHRMHFAGGLAYGRLFNIESNVGFGSGFTETDLSWILGIDYYFNRHFSLNLRYTRSLLALEEVTVNDVPQKIIPHHITLGAGYSFL